MGQWIRGRLGIGSKKTTTVTPTIPITTPPALSQLLVNLHTINSTNLGQTFQIGATGLDQYGSNFAITPSFVSSNPNVASVDSAGNVTSIGNGTCTITTTAGAFTTNTDVTVQVSVPVYTITGVSSNLNTTDIGNGTFNPVLNLNGTPVSGAPFSYVSTNPSVITVDASGHWVAQSVGSTTITISSGSTNFVVTVTITNSSTAQSLVLTSGGAPVPATFSGIAGRQLQLNDGAYISTAPQTDISSRLQYSTGDGTIAAIDQPEFFGPLTPNSIQQGTTVKITAPIYNAANVTGIANLPTGITVGPITVVDATHISFNMTAAVDAPLASNPDYPWKVITLLSTNHGPSETGAPLKILAGTAITSVTVTPANATLTPGVTQQLVAKDQNGNTLSNASWTSSNTSIATVNSSGLVTGVGVGSTTITAAIVGAASGSSTVTVGTGGGGGGAGVKTIIDSTFLYNAGVGTPVTTKAFNIVGGDTIKVAVSNFNGDVGYNTFTFNDTAGNTYAREAIQDDGSHCVAWYVAKNAIANAANVITVSSPVNPYLGVNVVQIRGASLTAPLDGTPVGAVNNAGNSASVVISTTDANDLILAAFRSGGNNGTLAVSGGLTVLGQSGVNNGIGKWAPGVVVTNATIGGGVSDATSSIILAQAVK